MRWELQHTIPVGWAYAGSIRSCGMWSLRAEAASCFLRLLHAFLHLPFGTCYMYALHVLGSYIYYDYTLHVYMYMYVLTSRRGLLLV